MQKLTGGILLSRNKDFLVFFRGKNFLSADVTQALLERERMAKAMQDEEDQARLRASSLLMPAINKSELSAEAGTLGETLNADAKWGKTLDERHKQKVMREVEQLQHAKLVRKLELKLSIVSFSSSSIMDVSWCLVIGFLSFIFNISYATLHIGCEGLGMSQCFMMKPFLDYAMNDHEDQ